MQRKTTTLLKLTLSLALLAAIVAYSGPREVLGALRSVYPALSALGFGGYQAIHVTLLGFWSVPAEQALAASLLQSGLSVLLYGIGCAAYLAGGRKPITPGEPEPRGVS